MSFDDYFEFVSAEEVRLRGTRVGIESILTEYLNGALPEEIAWNYPSVSLEQVHATITYYLANRDAADEYLALWTSRGDAALERQRNARSDLIDRLIQLRRSGSPA